ncbi:potassium transporter TrkA [Leptolyngbya valderiana BDU 20041]|nr:potassium transporter TrkA [Leptolyngbya valderiana BDU 20041]
MGIEAVIVLGIVAAVLLALMFTRIAADAIMVSALTALLVVPVPTDTGIKLGVLDPGQAIGGFASTGLATVAVLFVVVTGLRETGGIDWISARVLGRPQSMRTGMVRMTLPVAGMSAFLNNTPVVALMIPAVSDWCKRTGLSPSKFMLPLSYAAILGGTCSLIGTSTNLVVAGMVMDQTDLEPLGMFDITWVGLPCVVVGLAFLLLLGPRLLPNRGSPASVMADPREYTLEMIVPEGSTLAGKTVEAAGLRNLPGCFLVEVEREGGVMAAMGPHTVLRAGDRLVFAGVVEAIKDLQALRGLTPATDQVFKLDSPRFRRRLFEAVVSRTSPAAGQTIRAGRFRNTYDAVVIAVAREGERLKGKLGDIELKPGDTLLLEADPGFADRHRNSRDFLLVSALEDSAPRRHARAPLAAVFLAGMVALAALGVLDMLAAALVAAGLMVVTRCCTITEARRSIDWSVLIVIGAALGLGEALRVSGAAAGIADVILGTVGQHPWMVLLAIYVITSLATEVITNNAAVVLVFPIAVDAATRMDVSLMPFVIAIMIGGSASFATPLGYQTNLMVYGPGGYRFADFLRVGIPMNVIIGITAVILAPLVFPF